MLFRTSRQADALEACFLEEGLPYRVVGQKGFLEAEPVRQALIFFRYAFYPEEDLRLLNALALPPFHPGRAALADLRRSAGEGRLSDALSRKMEGKVEVLNVEAGRYRALAEDEDPETLLRRWGEEFGVGEDADFDRLVRVAAGAPSLDRLLDTILLGKEADYERAGGIRQPEAVTLMTLHASKGLEFPVVFICGVEDGLIPYRERETDPDEERRLFYVGLTRAQDEVVLLHARSRLRYGQRVRLEGSPFVRDIPEDLLSEERLEPGQKEGGFEQLSLW